jgi:hypothetical protein
LPSLLVLAACQRSSPPSPGALAAVEGALAGPSALLHGLCPEAPPTHDSFTGLREVQLEVIERQGPRLRLVVQGSPVAPTEEGELVPTEVRCEGELEATFRAGDELDQIVLRRGRKPGATLR